jgi:hypothetical protein
VLAPLAGGPAAWGQEVVIRLTIQAHRFVPAEIEVPAGQPFTLAIRNADATAEEFESEELKREKVIPPGAEVILRFGPLKAGTYAFYGEFNPKTAQGKLIVK